MNSNEKVFLTTLSRKFRKAGYKLTALSNSKKKKEKNDSLFRITPINSNDTWRFNICKTNGY
jgi:hypothetical protein